MAARYSLIKFIPNSGGQTYTWLVRLRRGYT